jgi:hypothetical protein
MRATVLRVLLWGRRIIQRCKPEDRQRLHISARTIGKGGGSEVVRPAPVFDMGGSYYNDEAGINP